MRSAFPFPEDKEVQQFFTSRQPEEMGWEEVANRYYSFFIYLFQRTAEIIEDWSTYPYARDLAKAWAVYLDSLTDSGTSHRTELYLYATRRASQVIFFPTPGYN